MEWYLKNVVTLQEINLTVGVNRVGRHANSQVHCPSVYTSRHHAIIEVEDDENEFIKVKDLKSSNGTFLNHLKVIPERRTDVSQGDTLGIGVNDKQEGEFFIFEVCKKEKKPATPKKDPELNGLSQPGPSGVSHRNTLCNGKEESVENSKENIGVENNNFNRKRKEMENGDVSAPKIKKFEVKSEPSPSNGLHIPDRVEEQEPCPPQPQAVPNAINVDPSALIHNWDEDQLERMLRAIREKKNASHSNEQQRAPNSSARPSLDATKRLSHGIEMDVDPPEPVINASESEAPESRNNDHIAEISSCFSDSIRESDFLLNASKQQILVKVDPGSSLLNKPQVSNGDASPNPDDASTSNEDVIKPSSSSNLTNGNSVSNKSLTAVEMFNNCVPGSDDEDDIIDDYEEEDSKTWFHHLSQSSMGQIIEILDSDEETSTEPVSGMYTPTFDLTDGPKPFSQKSSLLSMLNAESDSDSACASIAKRSSRSISSSGESEARTDKITPVEQVVSEDPVYISSSDTNDSDIFQAKVRKRLSVESSPEPEPEPEPELELEEQDNAVGNEEPEEAVLIPEDKPADDKPAKPDLKGKRKAEMIAAVPLPHRRSHLRGISAGTAEKMYNEQKNKQDLSTKGKSDKTPKDKASVKDVKQPKNKEKLVDMRREKLREISEKEKAKMPPKAPKPSASVKIKVTKNTRGAFLTESETVARSKTKPGTANGHTASKPGLSVRASTSKQTDQQTDQETDQQTDQRVILAGPRKRVSRFRSHSELDLERAKSVEREVAAAKFNKLVLNPDGRSENEENEVSGNTEGHRGSGKRIPKLRKKKVTFCPDDELVEVRYIDKLEGVKKFCRKNAKAKDIEVKKPERFESEDIIKLDILHWRPSWLHEQKQEEGKAPPPVVKQKLRPVEQNFSSARDYYQTMKSLLHHDVWAGITTAYDRSFSFGPVENSNSQGNRSTFHFMIESCAVREVPQTTRNYLQLNCYVVLFEEDIRNNNHPHKDDLVIVRLKFRDLDPNRKNPDMYFGLVTHHMKFHKFSENHGSACAPLVDSKIKKGKPCSFLVLKVLLNYGPFLKDKQLVTGVPLEMKKVKSIIPELRLYDALCSLPSYPLCNAILSPELYDFSVPEDLRPPLPSRSVVNLNSSQKNAVDYAVKMCLSPKPNICLIQGAPGTGKSLVITCIIQQLLRVLRANDEKGSTILVCASSNAAVDELVSKLGEVRQKLGNEKFSLVRVGTGVSQKGHPFALSELAKRKFNQHASSKNDLEQLKIDLDVVRAKKNGKLQTIQSLKSILEHYPSKAKSESDVAQLKEMHEKLKTYLSDYPKLETDERQLEYLIQYYNTPEAKRKRLNRSKDDNEEDLLRKAQVVAVTLSSCVTNQMRAVFKADSNSDGALKPPISVCIIDEATQCTEPEALIPLLLGIKSLVLVGDPNQLSPTIQSQTALNFGFGNSMFSRFYKSFSAKNRDPNCQKKLPLFFLDTQYRMHKEICQWPNKYFYEGKLSTHQSANARSTNSPLVPYFVLSTACKAEPDGETNEEEANMVVDLIKEILSRPETKSMSIGVITPYQKQKKYIMSRFVKVGKIPKEVEVNTIDSYQGSEKDIIILSTVRTSGMGFLENQQRVNVALTRAKCSLFICSNFISLQEDKMWKALLTDARNRKLYARVYTNPERQYLKYVLKPTKR